MSFKKFVLVLCVVLATMCLITGCNKNDDLIGCWEIYEDGDFVGYIYFVNDSDCFLAFDLDDDIEDDLTYTYEDDRIEISYDEDEDIYFDVEEKEDDWMLVSQDHEEFEFEKLDEDDIPSKLKRIADKY